jgi:DNA-directed RNA polymerase subunit H (RpoH/RPB5)
MTKHIKHMGMTLREEEHEKWHKEHEEITPEQHKELMKKMGISETEDKRWHEAQKLAQESEIEPGHEPVNPFAIGGGFLDYCVKHGWLIQDGKRRNAKYYITKAGEKELKKFDITV